MQWRVHNDDKYEAAESSTVLEHPRFGAIGWISVARHASSRGNDSMWEIELDIAEFGTYINEIYCGALHEARKRLCVIAEVQLKEKMEEIIGLREQLLSQLDTLKDVLVIEETH